MGPQEDYIETVVTCEGDYHDPQLQDRLHRFQQRLESLLLQDGKDQLVLKKVEPWNSVRVTFNIPREAALRLKQLAEQGNASLRQMGVLGVQIEGDRLVSLTVATPNNQRAELIIRTHDGPGQASAAAAAAAAGGVPQAAPAGAPVSFDPGLPSSSDELGSPGPSMEVTRKNIEEYLRQGFSVMPPSSSSSSNAMGPGPSGAGGPGSSDIFKTPAAEGGPFRANNIAGDPMLGPSGLLRPGFPGIGGSGAFAPPGASGSAASGHRSGPKVSAPHHTAQQLQQQLQQQQQQQMPSQGTALPQTAALGNYNMVGLPPPPPYPHGAGVANNVTGRQGKKMTASSPLLINLLQTEPLAGGANNALGAPGSEKPKKKRRRRKDKQASATATSEGQLAMHGLPLDSNPSTSTIPPQTMPSAEEMSAVLHRRVSPIPLPSPRLSAGFGPGTSELGVGGEGFRERNPPTASAALANLAQSQRVAGGENDPYTGDAIINPYTGHLEPRDPSASDLSPGKKDQRKAGVGALIHQRPGSAPHPSHPVSVSAGARVVRTGSSDSAVHIGLGNSYHHPAASVPSTLREEHGLGRGHVFASTPLPAQTHSVASESVLGLQQQQQQQRSDLAHTRVTTSVSPTSSSLSAAPHIYAQHPLGPSQPLSRMSHTTTTTTAAAALQHSSLHLSAAAAVNGPVGASPPPPSSTTHNTTVSSGPTASSSGQDSRHPMEGAGALNFYHHRPQPSLHADSLHNVPVSSEARDGGRLSGDAGSYHPRTTSSQPVVTHASVRLAAGAPPTKMTASVHAQSEPLKLLNSSSSSSSSSTAGVLQRVVAAAAAESAATATSTASPSGSKPPSDGDDNSNHSNVSPGGQTDAATAPSSLLDANGAKADNHDSGVGSASERSEDTTPSEVGDGEFQAGVGTEVSSTADSNNGGKVAVTAMGVGKTVVNCKKESSSGGGGGGGNNGGGNNPHTITVGYVQMNQHAADLYKDAAKHGVESAPMIGDKAAAAESLRQVSHLMKSTPMTHQVAMAAHKEIEMPLSISAKTSIAQDQRLMTKHKPPPVSSVHQNGPLAVPPGALRHQNPQAAGGGVVGLPNNTHAASAAVHHHHPTGITISHNQGQHHMGLQRPPPTSAPGSSHGLYPPPGSSSSSTSLGQPLHRLPAGGLVNNAGTQGLRHSPGPPHHLQQQRPPPKSQAYHPSSVGMPLTSSGHPFPPGSVGNSGHLHHPPPRNIGVSNSGPSLPHPPRSVANNGGGGHYHLPTSVPSSQGPLFHPGAHNSSHIPGGGGGHPHGVPTSQVMGHGMCSAASSLPPSFAPQATSSGGLESQAQQRLQQASGSMTSWAGQSRLPAGGLVAHSSTVMSQGQPVVASAMQQQQQQHLALPPQLARTPSPSHHHYPHPHPHPHHSHGHALPINNGPASLPLPPRCQERVPSPLVSSASPSNALDSSPLSRFPGSALPRPQHNDRGASEQLVNSAVNLLASALAAEGAGKGQMPYGVSASALNAAGEPQGIAPNPASKQGSPRLAPSNPSSMTVNLNKTSSNDLSSVCSDLMPASVVNDLDLLEAAYPHSEDVFDEDLTLMSEPGLSALLDLGLRHGASNGSSSGVSAEARGGSNITSMYAKRSSPINVNMLNHMYAVGLPQPRRLTESVQRLVKPLPNPENSLSPGRTCKSPGASSRHSSNGSASPGRAVQGGARSPGASVASPGSAAASRNLAFDKLTSSPSASINSIATSSGGGGGYPPAFHMAQPSLGGTMVNCVNSAVIPAAPHPLANLQGAGGGRVKSSSGSAVVVSSTCSPGSLSASSAIPSSSSFFSSQSSGLVSLPTSSSPSAVPALLTVTPRSVPSMVVSSHLEGATLPPHDALQPSAADKHSTMANSQYTVPLPPSSSLALSPSSSQHHPPLPALVHPESWQEGGLRVNRVSPPVVPQPSGGGVPSVVTAASNHNTTTTAGATQSRWSVPYSHPHRPQVSVCNTVTRVDSLSRDGPTPMTLASSSSSSLSSSSSSTLLPPLASSMSVSPLNVAATQPSRTVGSVPAAGNVVSATKVSSSLDLSACLTVASTSSQAASGVRMPTMSAGPTMMSKPVTVGQTGEVLPTVASAETSNAGSRLSESRLMPFGKPPANLDCAENKGFETGKAESPTTAPSISVNNPDKVSLKESVLKRVEPGAAVSVPYAVAQTSAAVAVTCSHNVASLTNRGPVSHTVVSEVGRNTAATFSGKGANQSRAAPPQSSLHTVENVTKLGSGLQSWSQAAPTLKESMAQEVGEGGGGMRAGTTMPSSSSMPPLSHHNDEDSAPALQPDHLHSKPPLLHPAPPLTLPTVLPSATPPPPPLTPVLLHDPSRKEGVFSAGHSTPPLSANAETLAEPARGVSSESSLQSSLSEASALKADYAIRTGVGAADTTNSSSKKDGEKRGGSETLPSDVVSLADSDTSKADNETVSSNMTDEEDQHKRFTRKRKSTHSESDSSSEPAPKLSCLDNAESNSEARTGSALDQPPKLHREGNRSNSVGEDKEGAKGGKVGDDKAAKKGEEKGGRNGEEQAATKEDVKQGEEEDRGAPKKEEEEKKVVKKAGGEDSGEKKDEEGGGGGGGEKYEAREDADADGGKREDEKGGKNAGHHDKNIVEATPEEIAKKMEAATTGGKRRVHYAYVPEKSLSQSYFDTRVLTGRTRSRNKDDDVPPPSSATSKSATAVAVTGLKEDAGEAPAMGGGKRSTRSLRTKDAGEPGQSKRKRAKDTNR